MKLFIKKFKDFPEDFFKNISPKVIIKAIKKKTSVAHVIPFAPLRIYPWFASTCLFNTIIPLFLKYETTLFFISKLHDLLVYCNT